MVKNFFTKLTARFSLGRCIFTNLIPVLVIVSAYFDWKFVNFLLGWLFISSICVICTYPRSIVENFIETNQSQSICEMIINTFIAFVVLGVLFSTGHLILFFLMWATLTCLNVAKRMIEQN